MLAKRIIACLDVRDGKVVKGTQFKNHEVMGDILDFASRYSTEGIDELVFYDIAASADRKSVSPVWVSEVAKRINIPFCVAGGINTIEMARAVLSAGADKISINSPALFRPDLIDELAKEFGSQCVVVGVDSKRTEEGFEVYGLTGRESTISSAKKATMAWIKEVQERGAGEVVLNCMDKDGTGTGYDLEQLSMAREILHIPLVASGGAKSIQSFVDVFKASNVDAALAARAFHQKIIDIKDLKKSLRLQGIEVRP